MAINKSAKLGDMEYDGLITHVVPPVQIGGRTIRKLGTAATLKRGTIMCMSSGTAGDSKVVMLGTTAASNETLTPDCILADDVDVGTSADVVATVYTAGAFDLNKCTVADDYTITAKDKDDLRIRDIVFVDAAV